MPCNTISTVKLELKNASFVLLKKALESLGKRNIRTTFNNNLAWEGSGYYNKETGILTETSVNAGNAVRRAYTTEVVKKQASRFGWQFKQTETNKYVITKR